ncbi:MAG: type II toxin-antitoxin system RelE/ParE family toxin [Xanthobacteraceae bacterium]|jgi:toxin ParE1/3/4|nr:type II toxin-antitoxin system RelE/ParE family toxin [Xanthobacteraceae bacterium]
MTERGRPAIWSPEAISDLETIWDYYARVAGIAAAEKLAREIVAIVANIEQHPMIGRARDEVREGLRSMAASPHVVFYRVMDDTPEIVRVLDGRQDIEDIFSE